MESVNNGSVQSSSGGNEEYDSRTESIAAFPNTPQPPLREQQNHAPSLFESNLANYFDTPQSEGKGSGIADVGSLKQRPGILMVGSPNVGKRTILSRLLSLDYEDASDLSSEVLVHGWNIDTKYYTADVSIWTAHLHDQFSITAVPVFSQLAALLMVFDMSDLATLTVLQDWVSHTDIHKFDILLCIGNKVDLIPSHSAHVEYRRRLQRLSDSADPYVDLTKYGLSETEGYSLLGDEEPSWEIKKSCLEWCTENNFEYIEACASNADFDKGLSVDGDSQGVERIYGALSAHMWPGMILKSGNKITAPSFTESQDLSEGESDYEIEYEVLSAGSAEPWDDTDERWVSADGAVPIASARTPAIPTTVTKGCNHSSVTNYDGGNPTPSIQTTVTEKCDHRSAANYEEENPEASTPLYSAAEVAETSYKHASAGNGALPDEGTCFEFGDVDQLMSEIGHMRDNLRLMPDFQRRDMAAELAMKMATMFGDNSGEEDGFE